MHNSLPRVYVAIHIRNRAPPEARGMEMSHKTARSGWSLLPAVQIVSFCVLIVFSLIGPLIPTARAASTIDVGIVDYAFQPTPVNVMPGDTVRWTNNVATPHSVVSDTGSSEVFSSPTLSQGQTFTHQFNTTGDFAYHCGIHPTLMHGTVSVGISSIPEFSNFAVVMIGLLVLMVGLTAALKRR